MAPTDPRSIFVGGVLRIMDEEIHPGCQVMAGGPATRSRRPAPAERRLMVRQVCKGAGPVADPVADRRAGMDDECRLHHERPDPRRHSGRVVEDETRTEIPQPDREEWR